jgi:hypothetical protein
MHAICCCKANIPVGFEKTYVRSSYQVIVSSSSLPDMCAEYQQQGAVLDGVHTSSCRDQTQDQLQQNSSCCSSSSSSSSSAGKSGSLEALCTLACGCYRVCLHWPTAHTAELKP